MRYLLFAILPIILLTSCSDVQSPEGVSGGQFRTTYPSQLYFKNIRSASYFQNTEAGSRIDLYRLRRFPENDQQPILYPLIAHNWMEDQAYLFIERNDYTGGWPDTLKVHWKKNGQTGNFQLSSQAPSLQYAFAMQLYESLKEGRQMEIETMENRNVPIFNQEAVRSSFLITMNDYLRLIERQGDKVR